MYGGDANADAAAGCHRRDALASCSRVSNAIIDHRMVVTLMGLSPSDAFGRGWLRLIKVTNNEEDQMQTIHDFMADDRHIDWVRRDPVTGEVRSMHRRPVRCADGFTVSVQDSPSHASVAGAAFEVRVESGTVPDVFVEFACPFSGDVFNHVPAHVVQFVIEQHGGIVG